MKKIFTLGFLTLAAFLFLGSHSSTAQVKSANAYLKVSSPGAQMVGEDGQPIRQFIINRFIILEVPSNQKLAVSKVSSGNTLFNATVEKLPAKFEAGKASNTGKEIKLKAARGFQLWKIALTPVIHKDYTEPLKNLVVQGKLNAKAFRTTIKREILLRPDELP